MELSYYLLTFNNGSEFYIKSPFSDSEKFKKNLKDSGFFNEGQYIMLRYNKSEPRYILASNLFGFQRVPETMIGKNTKLWEIL